MAVQGGLLDPREEIIMKKYEDPKKKEESLKKPA